MVGAWLFAAGSYHIFRTGPPRSWWRNVLPFAAGLSDVAGLVSPEAS